MQASHEYRVRPPSLRAALVPLVAAVFLAACGGGSDGPSGGTDTGVGDLGDIVQFDQGGAPTFDISGEWLMLRYNYGAPSDQTPEPAGLNETRFEQDGATFVQYLGPDDDEGVAGTTAGAAYRIRPSEGTYEVDITLADEDHGAGVYRAGALRFDFALVRQGLPRYAVEGEWVSDDADALPVEMLLDGDALTVIVDGEVFRGSMVRDVGLLTADEPPANGSRAARVGFAALDRATLDLYATSWIPVGAGHTGRTTDNQSYDLVRAGGGVELGSVRVTVTTSGDEPDEDGYLVTVGTREQVVDVDDVVTFPGLEPGSYSVIISEVAEQCLVSGGFAATVEVEAGGISDAEFSVACEAAACGDTDSNRLNCGGCEVPCDVQEFCDDSVCEPLRPLSRPLAWLSFSPDLLDIAEGGHDGTAARGEANFGSADGSSRALILDGETKVDLAYSGDFDVRTTSSHSIAMFIRPGAEPTGSGMAILTVAPEGGSTSEEHVPGLLLRPGYNVAWDYFFVGSFQAGVAPADTWSFVSLVVDGDAGTQTLRVWPQGGERSEVTGTLVGGHGQVDGRPWILSLGGTDNSEWADYDGLIDEFTFFNRALSVEELELLMGSGAGGCYAGAPVCSIPEPIDDACDDEPCAEDVACTDLPGEDPPYECGPCPSGTEGDGERCDDIDGCEGSPCYAGVACTDVPAPGTGFDCGSCPAGTTGDGVTCTPVVTTCEPACAGWQECVSGTCQARRCSSQGQCPGGYCFQGTCRNDGTCASRCAAVYGGGHTWQCINEGYCQINDCSTAATCPGGYDCVSHTDNSRGPGGAALFDKECTPGGSSPCGGSCPTLCSATSGNCL
jgi:hypothetical protein